MKIMTPKGKTMTASQYLATTSNLGAPNPCEYGHFGCALWDGGPCSDEVEARMESPDAEEERNRTASCAEVVYRDRLARDEEVDR